MVRRRLRTAQREGINAFPMFDLHSQNGPFFRCYYSLLSCMRVYGFISFGLISFEMDRYDICVLARDFHYYYFNVYSHRCSFHVHCGHIFVIIRTCTHLNWFELGIFPIAAAAAHHCIELRKCTFISPPFLSFLSANAFVCVHERPSFLVGEWLHIDKLQSLALTRGPHITDTLLLLLLQFYYFILP